MTTVKKKKVMLKSKATNAYDVLSEVREIILDEPLRYNQVTYLSTGDGPGFPKCGTVACVAGWTEVITGSTMASDVLGLTDAQAGELFFYGAVKGKPQTPMHAKLGAAHIARFQKKYAKQLKATRV